MNYKNQCSEESCNIKVYKNTKKCIFHCSKDNWITKSNPKNDTFSLDTTITTYWDEEKVKYFWNKFKKLISSENNLSKEESYLRFNNFIFPKMEQDTFKDYTINCDLVFNKNCKFEGNVYFFNTIFNGKVCFDNCKIRGDINFGKSIFKDRFTFNNMKKGNKVWFRFAEFKEKVEFKENHCKEIDFENTKFYNLADFHGSTFEGEINFEKTTFKDILVFTKVIFKDDVDFKYTTFTELVQFKETTFEKKLNLEDSIIKNEINFLKIQNKDGKNLKAENIENRETARIIKNSFEKQNNIIEANKFYALEMEKREEELTLKNHFFEWLVFKLHKITSNHSQNWFLVLLWIINISFIYSYYCFISKINLTELVILPLIIISLIIYICSSNQMKGIYKITCSLISYIFYGTITNDFNLKNLINNFNPFSIMTKGEDLTFSMLLYKSIIAYLIYQFIVSIRQNTRRK